MILLAQNEKIPKIICDPELQDSVHWLRAAGYDVQMPSKKMTDVELLKLAQKDNRVLVISEARIKSIKPTQYQVVPVKSRLVFEQLKQISTFLPINWLYKPLSRCMVCNSQLTELNISHWINLPAAVQEKCTTSHGCPSCERIYWPGDHLEKMVDQLKLFSKTKW